MSGQSLGLIETVGLAVAVEAADAAMKSANVALKGYELTKGGGLVTVKFTGEVGAMNAAIAAGVAAAGRVGSVYAWKVIARTASGIDSIIASKETYSVQDAPAVAEPQKTAIPVMNIEPVIAPNGDDLSNISLPKEAEPMSRNTDDAKQAQDVKSPSESDTQAVEAPAASNVQDNKAPAASNVPDNKTPAASDMQADTAPAASDTQADKAPVVSNVQEDKKLARAKVKSAKR